LYINNQAIPLLKGKEASSLIGKNLIKEYPEIKGTIFHEQLKTVLDTELPVQFEVFYKEVNKWFDIHGFPTNDGVFIYLNDISERKKIEWALRDFESRYRTLMEEASDAILVTNDDFKLLEVNKKSEELLGYTKEEFLNIDPKTLIHPEDIKILPLRLRELKEGQPIKGVRHIKKKDNSYVTVDGTAAKLSDGRMIFIIRDITEKELFEKRKDEFISMASHELKTPVTTIKGYTQMLKQLLKEQETPSYYLTRIEEEINRLTELVSDFLDISKIQSGKFRIKKRKYDLNQLIEETAEDMQQIADSHHISLELESIRIVSFDKNLIHQVLINLITNAIKFSTKKTKRDYSGNKIIIRTSEKRDEIIVSVQDFGVGISKENQSRIFERFFQITNTKDKTAGLGLGLYISSEIIKLHGGRIWVESEKNKGSTFLFSLPINGA
jgi:PAS domain S-box-containing protein